MIETKKTLRILAGVFLLVIALFSLGSMLITYFGGHQAGRVNFFLAYWSVLLSFVLAVLVAVFVFTRCFVGAGVAECVFALYALYSVIAGFITVLSPQLSSYLPKGYLVMSLAASLLSLGLNVLLVIGFFKHNRSAKPLFIVAGILACAASLVGVAQTVALPLMEGFNMPTATILATAAGGLLSGGISLLPWLFLAIYFGAQQPNSAETTPPAWSYDAPQQWSEPAPQQWSDPAPQQNNPTPQQQNNNGGWKPYP